MPRQRSPSDVSWSAAARWSPSTPARASSPRLHNDSTLALMVGLPRASLVARRERAVVTGSDSRQHPVVGQVDLARGPLQKARAAGQSGMASTEGVGRSGVVAEEAPTPEAVVSCVVGAVVRGFVLTYPGVAMR